RRKRFADLIHTLRGDQFDEVEESLRELVANSFDAYQRIENLKQHKVHVRSREKTGEIEVRDQATGMGLPQVLFKFLKPNSSENTLLLDQKGNRQSKTTTGRFGIGFYSALGFLGKG